MAVNRGRPGLSDGIDVFDERDPLISLTLAANTSGSRKFCFVDRSSCFDRVAEAAAAGASLANASSSAYAYNGLVQDVDVDE